MKLPGYSGWKILAYNHQNLSFLCFLALFFSLPASAREGMVLKTGALARGTSEFTTPTFLLQKLLSAGFLRAYLHTGRIHFTNAKVEFTTDSLREGGHGAANKRGR